MQGRQVIHIAYALCSRMNWFWIRCQRHIFFFHPFSNFINKYSYIYYFAIYHRTTRGNVRCLLKMACWFTCHGTGIILLATFSLSHSHCILLTCCLPNVLLYTFIFIFYFFLSSRASSVLTAACFQQPRRPDCNIQRTNPDNLRCPLWGREYQTICIL